MQPATRRRAIIRNAVMAGSVWETRMKMDEVKGGIKVFNAAGESRDDEEGLRVYRRLRRNQNDGVDAEKKKRKSWQQPKPQTSPIQLRKAQPIEIGCRRGMKEKEVLLICDGRQNEKEMEEEEEDDKVDIEKEERRSFDDKEKDLPVEKEKKADEVKKIEEVHEIQPSPPPMVVVEKKDSYVEDLKDADPDPVVMSQGEEEEEQEEEILFETSFGSSNRMQHIVDLVMWRDISKTAFAFGFGTFFLVSSSYAKDLNFSLISVISYLGLLYLAAIFTFRSILRRGEEAVDFDENDGSYLVGEEEAIWFLRRILPFLNEILLRTRALFSGDPATTMKMAVFLFVMGRCGTSITLWTLTKLAFFGVFTIPKVLSSYSHQLCRYGKFWVERFRDGWESCTHKKAIVAAIFTLIWNLSSTIARIWAVFMLVVALRLYQQCMTLTWDEEENLIEQNQHQQQQQQERKHARRGPNLKKAKK